MASSYTVAELAALTGAAVHGDGSRTINGVGELAKAKATEASFFANPRYLEALQHTHAGVVCVADITCCPQQLTMLIHDDPSRTFQKIVELLTTGRPPLSGFTGIHATAVIHTTALVGEGVTVGPYAVIDAGVTIGTGTHIGAHVYIGPETSVGENSLIHPRVVIREGCTIGSRVIIQPGAVIGACGFGYTQTPEGHYLKLEQVGAVIIDDDVEIGANTTIDRGRFPSQSTRIGAGVKLDNLVQVAHGVQIGAHTAIAGQSGIAGSTEIAPHSTIGGQVAIAGHLKLGSVRIAGKSGVSKSLPSGTYGGIPALPLADYNRIAVCVRKLPALFKKL